MPQPNEQDTFEPYIPASTILREITIKGVVLGIVLSVLLGGANAYLGLKAGLTVSASIPAAVMSMAILRLFKRSNILENNGVQTAASSGESVAAGVIFTVPALVMLNAWTTFNYWETTIIGGLGGMIGVLFTIPLRRALIVDSPLTFPEGVATAEVLKVGDRGGAGIRGIVIGSIIGAIFKLGETGIRLFTGTVEAARQVGSSVAYIGTNASPALLAVGYIVGINIAILVFLGGALNWFVAIPIAATTQEWPHYVVEAEPPAAPGLGHFPVEANDARLGEPVAASEWAYRLWSKRTRFIGVGAMVVGGLWALVRLRKSLVSGIASGFAAYRGGRAARNDRPRTERDAPMPWIIGALAFSVVPLFFVFHHATHDVAISAVMSCVMLVAGFLFSAVASYMAGLVGSSNNPISGVTIATLLTSALLLLALGIDREAGPVAAVLIGSVVCCAAAIGGDNMQDLKTGRLLGATPWKLQIMQSIGVLAGAFVLAPVLAMLLKAYGIGDIHVAGQKPLEAPQATLMMAVARGVFARDLPWAMVGIGVGLAVAVIALDLVLEKRGSTFRMPVLAVAVGTYLRLELSVPILIGGLVAYAIHRWHTRRIAAASSESRAEALVEAKKAGEHNGLLLAAGLITGEALFAILLAIPLAIWQGENKFAGWFEQATGLKEPYHWPGLVFVAVVAFVIVRAATNVRAKTSA